MWQSTLSSLPAPFSNNSAGNTRSQTKAVRNSAPRGYRSTSERRTQSSTFRVQLCRNVDEQNVEDCWKQWPEDKSPFETVARVMLPQREDVFQPKRRALWDREIKLNVWDGLAAHKPLGGFNRLKKSLYEASLKIRQETNAADVKLVSVDEIP